MIRTYLKTATCFVGLLAFLSLAPSAGAQTDDPDVATDPGSALGIPFRRGDATTNGTVDIADPVATFAYLFRGGKTPRCFDAVDTNDDGRLDIADGVASLRHLFQGTFDIPAPGTLSCDLDPTSDGLGCESYYTCDGFYEPDRRFDVGVLDDYTVSFETADTVTPQRDVKILIRHPIDAPAPHPVILWSHGGSENENGHLLQTTWGNVLASAGYVVIHMAHGPDEVNAHCAALRIPVEECDEEDDFSPVGGDDGTLTSIWYNRPRDASAVLDDLANIEAAFGLDLDPERVGYGGWSGGAHPVMTIAGARIDFSPSVKGAVYHDPRVLAFLANSPQGVDRLGMSETSWEAIESPVLIQTGSEDRTEYVDPVERLDPYKGMPPGDKYLHGLDSEDAIHGVFGLTANADQRLKYYVANAGVAFFDAELMGRPEAKGWLQANPLSEISEGVSTIATK